MDTNISIHNTLVQTISYGYNWCVLIIYEVAIENQALQ